MGDFRGNAGNGEVTDPEGDNGTGAGAPTASAMRRTLARARDGKALDVDEATVLLHARGEDLIEESLKSLEEEFGERFVRIHRNCLVARHELVELRRAPDGHVHAVLRHGQSQLEVSRRCVSTLRETVRHL